MSDLQQWLYTDASGAEHGPVSANELRQLAAAGNIHSETNVWTEGLDEWIHASQVEGLVPVSTFHQPLTPQPGINLGAGSGIHLESTIVPHAMGQGDPNTYTKPPKSRAMWIVFGILALLATGVAVYISKAVSEQNKFKNIPGYTEFSDTNKKLTLMKNGNILGNNDDALEIAKRFSKSLQAYRMALQKASAGGTPITKEANKPFPTYCLAKTERGVKTVVIIVEIPTYPDFAADAKSVISTGAWSSAQLALSGTAYEDTKTRLAVGLRSSAIYTKVMVGQPKNGKADEQKPMEGVTDSHTGDTSEEKLYPFFEKK